MKNFFLLVTLCGMCTLSGIGQTTDLARIEYTYFPQSDSDNSFRRFRTFFKLPIPLKKEGTYLVPGVEYRNVHLRFDDETPFLRENLDRFESYNFSLGYTTPLKNNWRIGVEGGLIVASNFRERKPVNDDVIYSGAVYFIKDNKGEGVEKPWRLVLGLQYSTTAGRPFPLPIVNYFKQFDEDWSYTLGVPKTNVKYYFNDRNIVQTFVTLDGFFGNVQNNINFQDSAGNRQIGENVSMTIVLSGLGYEHYFTDHILWYVYTGYTLLNDIRIRDGERNDVFTINDVNSFYARSGIKLKI